MAIAFKCRNCGRVEEPGEAGERSLPRGCRVCGKGTHFELDANGMPVAVDDNDNWIVLADLDAAELAATLEPTGHDKEDVVRHEPGVDPDPSREPQIIERHTEDTLGAEDVAS